MTLTADYLKTLFSYDEATGLFVRKINQNKAKAGENPGKIDAKGYRVIQINGSIYKAHRLVWLYVYGEWPSGHIDHINRVRSNNRIQNLRVASFSENNSNTRIRCSNTSGFTGVTLEPSGKYRAQISINGKKKYLGLFNSADDASSAYFEAIKNGRGKFFPQLRGELSD